MNNKTKFTIKDNLTSKAKKLDSLTLLLFIITNENFLTDYFTIIDFSDSSKTTEDLLQEIIAYYNNPDSYNEIEIVKCPQKGGKLSSKYKKRRQTHTRKLIKKKYYNTKKKNKHNNC